MAILEDYPSTNTPLSASVLFNAMYPVGCIYQTVDGNFNPNTDFGIGTWAQIKDVFLLAAGDNYTGGTTGGSATHVHTLNDGYAMFSMGSSELHQYEQSDVEWVENMKKTVSGSTASASSTRTYGTALGGSTDSGSNLPPYEVVYMWKRTA